MDISVFIDLTLLVEIRKEVSQSRRYRIGAEVKIVW